ncbi:AraC-type DNA-binding protein [Chitinophaga sp. CF118]|uniref:helix-turn-helix domain-containing protein n=1 Tax=Chitinophaga sp. CF118 TaxID=1884367 RepID=UPI0008E943EF|nr:AraC family transcriptional regulator [Chitinophaga sp. CF118]SFD58774.1 AraC-type DNA-binding protein [Chitinophaga sp. CF118]
MTKSQDDKSLTPILYSCYVSRSREGEQFVKDHVFSYHIAGTLIMNDGNKEYIFGEGDFRFLRKNHLVKFAKQPQVNGEYKSLSIYLDQQTLRNFSMEYGYKAEKWTGAESIISLQPDPLYKGYLDSLKPYDQITRAGNENLVALKLKEAILLLLHTRPDLKDVLFDFSEPDKIDLEGFMQQNYHFNVELKRFAYLTGRSLTTFKRDFEKIFHSTPSRWLQQRRLQEAHYLIKEKGKAPSDVYLDLGFEDLSHFSFAFKKMYGVGPSKI